MTETKTEVSTEILPVVEMDDDQLLRFCAQNKGLRIERTEQGSLEVMPLTGGETGGRNFVLNHLLAEWVLRDATGTGFDSSTGFVLPNGAMRSPDAAWVRRGRLAGLPAEQRQKSLPLCPDFVVELRSPSDPLPVLQGKMEEYLANGARLGWLLDVPDRRVYVYRPGKEPERLNGASEVSGDPELPRFVLDLNPIWEPGF